MDNDTKCIEWRLILKSGDLNLIQNYIDSNDIHHNSDYPLRWSARFGITVAIKPLIVAGANIHIYDDTPLFFAAYGGYLEIVQLLLEAGANVHTCSDHPIRYAVERSRTEMVKLLIKFGADIHINNDIIICLAALHGFSEIIKILIDSGSNINTKGGRPLRLAIRESRYDVVKLLIDSGAEIKQLTLEEKDKLDWILKTYFSKVNRQTAESCLINHVPINVGEEYYSCSVNSEHIYSKNAIELWNRGLNCLLCFKPLQKTIYINQ